MTIERVGLWLTKYITVPLCILGLVLCWADKLSILYDPWWFYLPRAWLSGELKEYRKLAADAGFVPLSASHREWFAWIQDRLGTLGKEKRGDAVPYVNQKR